MKEQTKIFISAVLGICLIVAAIGFGGRKIVQWAEQDVIETVSYNNSNPTVTIINKETREVIFRAASSSEGRAEYLRKANYDISSASRDRYGYMYIVKVKEIE